MQVGDHFYRCWRRWILGTVLLLMLLMASGAIVLAGDGILEFIDANPLALKHPLEPVYYVALKNTADAAVEGIDFRVVALQGPKGESLGDDVLLVEPSPGTTDTVKANSVGTFELTFSVAETVVLSNGTYSGFLAAEATGVDPVHRPLTWEVGPPGASDAPVPASDSLAFINEETLELKDSLEPVYVALTNGRAEPVERIEFRVVSLRGPEGEFLGDGVLSVKEDPNALEGYTLDGYSVGTFELAFTSTTATVLADGIYNGFLAVEASGVQSVQKALTWQHGGRATLVGFVPEAESLTLDAVVEGPSFLKAGQQMTVNLATLQLYGDVGELDLDAIDPVSTTLSTEDGRTVAVVLDGFRGLSDTELETTLRLSGLISPGKYTGSLMLVPTDPENEKSLTITVLVKDHWVWPLFVTLMGLLFSYAATRWWKCVHPGWDVERQALATLADIEDDHKSFTQEEDNAQLKRYTIVESAKTMVKAVQDLIAEGKLDDARKRLEALLGYFRAYQIFRGSAQSLRNSYEVLVEIPDLGGETSLQTMAAKLFPGRQVKGPEDLDGLIAQVGALREFYALFVRVYGRWKLGRDIKLTPSDSWESEDVLRLKRAKARLDGVKTDLRVAGSTQDLIIWRVERRVGWALECLRELKQIYPPRTKAGSKWELIRRLQAALSDVAVFLRAPDLGKVTSADRRRYAAGLARLIRATDSFFILFGWIVAAGTAMWALYAGKTFGTEWDYLAAFVWGSGVDQGLKGLSAVLSKLGIGQA